MNIIKEYIQEILLVLGLQSRRIQHIDNSVTDIKNTIRAIKKPVKKTTKKGKKVV